VHHVPLVRQLAHIICNGNIAVSSDQHNLPAQVKRHLLYSWKATV